jgi:hypothetical protein
MDFVHYYYPALPLFSSIACNAAGLRINVKKKAGYEYDKFESDNVACNTQLYNAISINL